MSFSDVTRRQIIGPVTTFTRVSGQQQRFDLPRAAALSRLWLTTGPQAAAVRGVAPSVVTTPTALANTFGNSAFIRRVRLVSNNGQDIYNVSGPGYFFGLAPYIDFPANMLLGGPSSSGSNNASTARSAVATTTNINLDMMIPVALNLRDEVGLFPLQNEQTLVTVIVEWESDANIAATLTMGNGQPTLSVYEETFTIPQDPRQQPDWGMVHQILEDQTTVSGSGVLTYMWPRGNIVLQMLHLVNSSATVGAGIATTSDGFTRVQLRANQSTYIHDSAADFLDVQNAFTRIQTRLFGQIPFDYLGTSGLGNYDQLRDVINTRELTDLATVATLSASGTFYSIRRQLVPV